MKRLWRNLRRYSHCGQRNRVISACRSKTIYKAFHHRDNAHMGPGGCVGNLFLLRDSSSNSIAGPWGHRPLHTKSDVVLKRNASHPFGDAIAIKSPQLIKELWRKIIS